MRRLSPLVLAAVAVSAVISTATGHELAEAGATLLVREGGVVELRLNVPWSTVLRQRQMPDRPMREFLARAASQPRAEFARDVAAVQRIIERETRVADATGEGVTLQRWQWPSAAVIHDAIQREFMSSMVNDAAHEHASRLAATAQAKLPQRPGALRARFPAVLGPVLLTITVPQQAWLPAGGWSKPLSLGGRP